MADDVDQWKACPIGGWQKLDRTCNLCGKPHADIEFVFSCKGLPKKYMQTGTFTKAWHWACLPEVLRQYQSESARSMVAAAQTPPGLD